MILMKILTGLFKYFFFEIRHRLKINPNRVLMRIAKKVISIVN